LDEIQPNSNQNQPKRIPQVFNAAAQSGAYHLPRLAAAGYGTFRIELVDESPGDVEKVLNGYKEALSGTLPPGRLFSLLSSLPNGHGRAGGVSGGSLDVKSERAAATLRPTAATLRAGERAGVATG
jgi:hypothetical protein